MPFNAKFHSDCFIQGRTGQYVIYQENLEGGAAVGGIATENLRNLWFSSFTKRFSSDH